jgi:dihydrofolate synthase / folylpolyglutamate synthase
MPMRNYRCWQVCERESINIGGAPLSADAWLANMAEVEEAVAIHADSSDEDSMPLTNFELLTAAAYLTFSRSVDVAVIEVGLGGLRDATNIIDEPAVCAITSVSEDHGDLLGNSIVSIAREKAGILKHNCPAVIGPLVPEAATVVAEYWRDVGAASLTWSTPSAIVDGRSGWASHRGLEFPLVLGGKFQLANSAVSVDTLCALRENTNIHCSDEHIVEGMRTVHWPGRLQWVDWPTHCDNTGGEEDGASRRHHSQILLDGAHNLDAALALREYVDEEHGRLSTRSCHSSAAGVAWVIAMSRGKDVRAILSALLRPNDIVFVTEFEVGAAHLSPLCSVNGQRPLTLPTASTHLAATVDALGGRDASR